METTKEQLTRSDLVKALRDLMHPNNFRADPTLATIRARDRALARAYSVIAKIAKE